MKNKIKLRKHQKKQQKKMFKALDLYDKVVFQAPTGWGKSINILKIVKQLIQKEFRVLIIAPRRVLVKQLLETCQHYTPYLLMGSDTRGILPIKQSQVVVASMSTLKRRSVNVVGTFDYIIVDEAHMIDITQIEAYGKKIIGFTATPLITKKSHCAKYDYIIPNKFNIGWLINNGYLAKFKYIGKKIDISNFRHTPSNNADFDNRDIEDFTNTPSNVQTIVDAYNKHCIDKKTIIFCSSIQHATLLKEREEFQEAKIVHSKMNERDVHKNLALFKKGKVNVILNVSMLTTGFDDPSIEVLILARPTKSKMLYSQIMGRVLRYHHNIKKVLILDLVDAYELANDGLLPHMTYWDSGLVSTILKKKEIMSANFTEIEHKIYVCKKCGTEYRYIDCRRKTTQSDDMITTEIFCPNEACNEMVDIKELDLSKINVDENLSVLNKKVVDYSIKYTQKDVLQFVSELIKLNTQNAKTKWATYIIKKCMLTDKKRFKELIYGYAQTCYTHQTVWKNIMKIYQR